MTFNGFQSDTETHVLAVLAGTPLNQAAERARLHPADLTDAIEMYRAAGRAALETQVRASDWYQLRIQFTEWNTAEQAAASNLGAQLQQLHQAGVLTHWWFLRKHPCWRLRCLPGPNVTRPDMAAAIENVLDALVTEGIVEKYGKSLYEPETFTFGGAEGMDIAHALFHADSSGAVTYLRHDPPGLPVGRRELSVLLCAALFRAALQDDHEQADIWHRVVHERPLAVEPPKDKLRAMAPALTRLVSVDTTPSGSLLATHGPLVFAESWLESFATAGRALADAARDGTLERGLRAVLASHVIFHWNRLGLPAATQAVLARALRETVLNPPTPDADQ